MIQDARDADRGFYECIARNTAGEVKTDAVELRMSNQHHHQHHQQNNYNEQRNRDRQLNNQIERHPGQRHQRTHHNGKQ